MHTRKSAPLPNPNDTLNQYRINYETHYQHLHKYLISRVYKEKQVRNQLIRQFDRYGKAMRRISDSSQESSTEKQLKKKQIKQKLQKVYQQICVRQLQIQKLLQQDRGVIEQLCELLNSKEKEIRCYRETNVKGCNVAFLSYVRKVVDVWRQREEDIDRTVSIEFKDDGKKQALFEKALDKGYNDSGLLKDLQQNLLNENTSQTKNINQQRPQQGSENDFKQQNKDIETQATEQTISKEAKTSTNLNSTITNKQSSFLQNEPIEMSTNTMVKKQINEQLELHNDKQQKYQQLIKIEQQNQKQVSKIKNLQDGQKFQKQQSNLRFQNQQNHQNFKSKILSIIDDYKKIERFNTDPNKFHASAQNFIELNSSTEADPIASQKKLNSHILKGRAKEMDSKRAKLQRKKLLKSCITILD